MWFSGKRRGNALQTYQSTGVLVYCPYHPHTVMFRDILKVQEQQPKTPDEELRCYTCGDCYKEEQERKAAYAQIARPYPRNLLADYQAGELVRQRNRELPPPLIPVGKRQLLPVYNLERFPTSILDDDE